MYKFFLAFFCLLLVNFNAQAGQTKTLIFLVDQHFGLPVINIPLINVKINTIKLFDYLRSSYLASFNNQIQNSEGYWSQTIEPVYDEIFYVLGEDCRNKNYMKNIWQKAIDRHDVIDYVALVHHAKDDLWFDEAWEVPRKSGKIRLVYSSGCHSGNGAQEIIENYGALAAVGHNYDARAPSASPFFSFRLIESWVEGKNLKETIELAWEQGQKNVHSLWAIPLLKNFNYQSPLEAILASRFEYSYNANIDIEALTIESKPPASLISYEYYTGRAMDNIGIAE